MSRLLSCAVLILIVVGTFLAQQPPQSAPWNVTMQTNTVADSTLTVMNRCKQNHQFQIQTQNVPFLQVPTNQANVKGGQTQVIPVKFDTRNLAPGVYQGQVLVICVSCKSEATCMQDREVLQVNLRVTGDQPGASASPGAATTNPPTGPPTTNQAATTQPAPPLGNPQGPGASGIMLSPIPEAITEALANALKKKERVEAEVEKLRADVAAAQQEADKARQAAEDAEQAERNAKAQAEAEKKAKDDAVNAVNAASDAVDKAKAELVAPNRTREERAAARTALEKAEAALAAAKKALEEARAAIASGKTKAAAAEAAKKAKEKKAEADKAAAALAAAQKALAEKEKELLQAKQEVAKAQAAKDKAEQEAREREAAKVAAEKAAWEKLWAEDIKRRQEEQERLAARAVEIDYLLDNIKKLGLIPDKPKRDVPDPTDYFFNKLRQLAGQTVGDFLQTVAGELSGGPLPTGVIGVLGEMYNGIGSFFNLSTGVGYDNILKTLQGMNNPNVKPPNRPRNYTENEAADKIRRMQQLMEELKKKLAAAQAAAGK